MEYSSLVKNHMIHAEGFIANIESRTQDRKIKSDLERARKSIINAGEHLNDPLFLHKITYARNIVKSLINTDEIKKDRSFMAWASQAISQLNACIQKYNENKDRIAV